MKITNVQIAVKVNEQLSHIPERRNHMFWEIPKVLKLKENTIGGLCFFVFEKLTRLPPLQSLYLMFVERESAYEGMLESQRS